MAAIDRAPMMEAYVESLPRGLDSYPQCQQKAVVFRQFITPEIRHDIEAALPDELRALADEPPALTAWISEVHATAIYLAYRDSLRSDQAFVQLAYTVNQRLLSGPLYRILFAVASPARVLRGAASRWGQMHRGTDIKIRRSGDRDAVLRLSGPQNHIPHTIALAYATAYRVALELAGATDATVECDEGGSTGYTYSATWR